MARADKAAPGGGAGAPEGDAGTQTWDPDHYHRNARFVADLALPVVDLLDPRPGEDVLDLGCGDGFLTLKLMAIGCRVVGVDASAAMVEGACRAGVDARVADVRSLDFREEFDAVFSNATLHWVKEPETAIGGAWNALRPGGRFCGEFGGFDCVALIRGALGRALERRGIDIASVNPWYFPTAEDYGNRLAKRGFQVEQVRVFPRPTPLPGEMADWLETFAQSFAAPLAVADRPGFYREAQDDLREALCQDGKWSADYTRLRFLARKPSQPEKVA